MKKFLQRWWSVQRTSLLGGLITCLCLVTATPAQDKDKKKDDKAPEIKKWTNLIRAGYTRPGSPEDKLNKDGTIRPLAWDVDYVGKLLGGTIYFVVLERTGAAGDSWGTGIANFDERFVEGRAFRGGFSPNLDSKARYLYLYMVVNDRGLDPPFGDKVASPAAAVREKFDKQVSPVASTALRLVVDPRYLTSWGHFKGSGFTVEVPDRFKSDFAPVADNLVAKIRLAVSGNTSFLDQLPYPTRRYLDQAPANPLRDLKNTFAIGASNENGEKTHLFKALAEKRDKAAKAKDIKLLSYENNLLEAGQKGGKEPEFVQILFAGYQEGVVPALAEDGLQGQAVFRADFRGPNLVGLGQHSVLFGFTTDLPPMDETIRLEDPEDALKGNGIVPAANATGVAPGTAVTPTPPAPAGTPVLGGGFQGLLGGQVGGVGGPGLIPAGAIGAARPGFGGGGGFGTTAGEGGQQQQQNPNQAQDQAGSINFNATLTNNQQQQQKQSQSQSQSQTNCCDGNGNGEVIPEPAAFLLGLLGLPVLIYLRRRKGELPAVLATGR